MSSEYPLKHVRLQQLHDAGFNTANFICFPPGELNEKKLRAFIKKHGKVSCRNFHADEANHFKCQVLYDQTDAEAVLEFYREQNKTFYSLCNEAINVKESVCAGNILVNDENNYFIEYFYGPGTPRDVESKGPSELKTYSKSFGEPARGDKPPDEVLQMAFKARKFQPINKAYIVEFSVYPYPIGRNQTETICWEWRWGWLHYQLQANQYLLENLKTANMRIKELEEENRRLTFEQNRRISLSGHRLALNNWR